MGYNLNRGSFNRNKPQLDQLLTEQTTLLFPTSGLKASRSLARNIREAIRSALMFDDLGIYWSLDIDYRFRETDNGVLAEFIKAPFGIVVSSSKHKLGSSIETGVQELMEREQSKNEGGRKKIEAANNVIDVIAQAMKHEDYFELSFPNAAITDRDKHKIYFWADKNGWKYIDQEDHGLTLTKDENIPEDMLWMPKESSVQNVKVENS